MGLSVQFTNKGTVIRAYENRNVEAWSLWQGRQFLFKGMGTEELETVLNAIADGGTNGIYTLKVYEDIEDSSLIKSKTEDDGSFNFRLNEPSMGLPQHTLTSYNHLDERLKRLEESPEVEDIEEVQVTTNSIIGELMGNPAIAALIPVLIDKLVNFLGANQNKPPESQNQVSSGNVVESMKAIDPNFENHLAKLQQIAVKNPALYDMLIANLETMPQ